MASKFVRSCLLALFSTAALGQTCPKVSYTTANATLKALVAAVNCLSGANAKPIVGESSKSGLQVDSYQIIGPQHTKAYRRLLFVVLLVPTASGSKGAVAAPDAPEASVASTGGAECRVKVNLDNTVEAQCNLTGGMLYVAYR
jgi:hypothetical protein